MKDILKVSERIAESFDPDRIIFFGSRAYGQPRRDSDVDLLVILPFDGNSFDKSTEILSAVDSPLSVDVQAVRPADARRRYRQWDPMIRDAFDRGKILYERNHPRMAGKGRGRLRQRSTRTPGAKSAQL